MLAVHARTVASVTVCCYLAGMLTRVLLSTCGWRQAATCDGLQQRHALCPPP